MCSPSLRIHYLQHVPFEGPGHIADWGGSREHTLTCTRFFEADLLPGLDKIDWLVIMGGPMSVHDEVQYPWLRQEKEFIKQAIAAGKTVIGICLGAQLIAQVLDARVYPNPQKEIGWFPLRFSEEAVLQGLLAGLPPELTVFHWHGETFDLPENAIRIASSDACRNQGFLYNERVLGLQFHMEATASSIAEMVKAGAEELSTVETISGEASDEFSGRPGGGSSARRGRAENRFLQTSTEILSGSRFVSVPNRCLEQLLDRLAVFPQARSAS